MMKIRKATRADAQAAWDIRKEAILKACTQYYPADLLTIWTSGAPNDVWADAVEQSFHVGDEGGLVAVTGMLNIATGQVDAMFVRPSHMGLGIGRQMMDFLERLAHSHGIVSMNLSATLNAAPFYRHCGWIGDSVEIYKSPRGIELACVPMTKAVTPPESGQSPRAA
ncbi:GNAT family N-acetyltransferase [Solimonas sp. K1W22B-7]|uniref:GNAT family N-acetyltransferase n=1 Tax=Solimonas sp. K1W22B-7 TaxID=2303331 RepID=UPI000E337B3D|nr:GNAT family N-acetyltransferase [Solimonas sp. K1W22B-7]